MDLVCHSCESRFTSTNRKRCACGEPLWFDIDSTQFDWTDLPRTSGVWRYADVLPADPAEDVTAGAGGTPLIRAERLDEYAGCRLYVKDEGQNPTGSFKDRGSSVGVTYADDAGRDWVGTVSHGNMAMSMAAVATSKGVNCAVLVPVRIPETRLGLIAQYDPEILTVTGDYGQLYYDTLDADGGIEFVNSDTPLRVAGQKTVAYEILESFAPETPDAIVLPVSSGGHASAVWKALRELRDATLIEKLPRIHLVQTAAVDPIAQAFRTGADSVEFIDPSDTVAFSISNGSPPSGNRALRAARETNGTVTSVSEEAIKEATRRLASNAGVCAEPASAVTLAGLNKLSQAGEITPNDEIVAIVTGTGFKESEIDIDVSTTDISLANLKKSLEEIAV
jgi:threonine synthase